MRISSSRPLKRTAGIIIFLTCVMLASVVTAGTAQAKPKAAKADALIANDGTKVTAPVAGEANVQGFKGTGKTNGHTASSTTMQKESKRIALGGGSAESVIGVDRRVQDTATTAYPARATVWITFSTGSGGASCTGFMISPDVVATAGHCIHKGTGGTSGFYPVTSFSLYPGRNGATIPYKCPGGAIVKATKLWTNTGWANGGGETKDYGAIQTSCPIGNTVGYYGFINTGTTSQNGIKDTTRGYPGDKPSGTQWRSDNCSTSSTTFVQCTVAASETRQLFYKNDTFGGQSGSPVYRIDGTCVPCAIAIHAYGLHGSGNHSSNNHGTRIESNVYNFLYALRYGVTSNN